MRQRKRISAQKKTLSHVAPDGSVRMVDVGTKPATERRAIAKAIVNLSPAAARMIAQRASKKGDVMAAAQIAGILAAKRTPELIPLCHQVPLTHVDITCRLSGKNSIEILCSAASTGPTGVEMEALTGAAAAALTIYDMCKAVDRNIVINDLSLLEKSGGRSGHYRRQK